MNRKIKLIWEFRGPNAQKTAEHHCIHLKEYSDIKKIPNYLIDTIEQNEFAWMAIMVVDEIHMNTARNDLKPHRGQVYIEN